MYGNAVLHLVYTYVDDYVMSDGRSRVGLRDCGRRRTGFEGGQRERETGNAERQGKLSDRGSTGLGY